jgi:hypothetical protein
MKQDEKAAEPPEPPSCLQPPIFVIGKDSKGNWVAQDKSGLRGGLFVDRAQALKFAKFECGPDPHAILAQRGTGTRSFRRIDSLIHATACGKRRPQTSCGMTGRGRSVSIGRSLLPASALSVLLGWRRRRKSRVGLLGVA